MGGKGIFGPWFKELATLIFTQTIQAFLLAIIMSIIVGALSASNGAGSAYGAGLLAVIALSQFGKIELLIKNIFGVTSQFNAGSMESGKGGLLGAWAAMKGAKHLANNAGKIVGGTVGGIKSGIHTRSLMAQRKGLQAEVDADQEAFNLAEGKVKDAQNTLISGADTAMTEAGKGYLREEGAKASRDGTTSGGGSGSGLGISNADIKGLELAIRKQTEATAKLAANQAKLDAKKNSMKEKQEKLTGSQERLKALDAQIMESKKKTSDRLAMARSGLAETAAAIPAGVVGASVGLAGGDIGKAVTYGIGAAGAADKVVSSTMATGRAGIQGSKEIIRDVNEQRGFGVGSVSDQKRIIKEEIKKSTYGTSGTGSSTNLYTKKEELGAKRNYEKQKARYDANKAANKYNASNM